MSTNADFSWAEVVAANNMAVGYGDEDFVWLDEDTVALVVRSKDSRIGPEVRGDVILIVDKDMSILYPQESEDLYHSLVPLGSVIEDWQR